jgi:outer membrane protein assembly factor BamB
VGKARIVLTAALALGLAGVVPAARAATQPSCASQNWPEYGAGPALTFEVPHGCSSIDSGNVSTLLPKWFFHTKDSVTASPTVVDGTVYVGSWDGTFYALDAATGAEKWSYTVTTDDALAFGMIVSSAEVVEVPEAGIGSRQVVLFGGGSSLWALDAATGKLLATVNLDPRTPALQAAQASNPPTVEVESSPVVVQVPVGGVTKQVIYVGFDTHNTPNVGPAGIVALHLIQAASGAWSFDVLWKHDPENDEVFTGPDALTEGSGTGFGCGDVWSSPAVDVAHDEVLYGTGDCEDPDAARAAGDHWSEAITAIKADTGATIWRFSPDERIQGVAAQDAAAERDQDFGASPNLFALPDGTLAVGEGSKSATYWVRNRLTGAPIWDTKSGDTGFVQDGFAVGGFIGTTGVETAADGTAERIIGTAIPVPIDTTDPADTNASDVEGAVQSVRAFDAATGKVDWTFSLGGPTYAATTVVNDVALVPDTVPSVLIGIDAANGLPLFYGPVIGPPSSAAVVAGNSVYLGTGTRETDLEYKALGLKLEKTETDLLGESPLSPISGVQAWELP